MNTILKDSTVYCNMCGLDYAVETHPCCEEPQLGTHMQHVMMVVKQNKELRKSRRNEFASTKDASMRWGASLPPRFFEEWDRGFRRTYKEKLIRDQKDFRKFMKKFKAFTICEVI